MRKKRFKERNMILAEKVLNTYFTTIKAKYEIAEKYHIAYKTVESILEYFTDPEIIEEREEDVRSFKKNHAIPGNPLYIHITRTKIEEYYNLKGIPSSQQPEDYISQWKDIIFDIVDNEVVSKYIKHDYIIFFNKKGVPSNKGKYWEIGQYRNELKYAKKLWYSIYHKKHFYPDHISSIRWYEIEQHINIILNWIYYEKELNTYIDDYSSTRELYLYNDESRSIIYKLVANEVCERYRKNVTRFQTEYDKEVKYCKKLWIKVYDEKGLDFYIEPELLEREVKGIINRVYQ